MTSKTLFLPFLFLVPFCLSCNKDHPLDKKDALNSLKILNSDITNLTEQASEKPWFQAMKFLYEQSSSPLPFNHDTTAKKMYSSYSFAEKKGVYLWDAIHRTFVKEKDTSLILLRFPLLSEKKSWCKFFLYDYETQNTRSRPGFPVNAEASLYIDDHKELSLSHRALLAENMPSALTTEITGSEFHFRFTFNREGNFSQKSGVLKGNILLEAGRTEILSSAFNIDIDYHPPVTYSLEYIRFLMKIMGTDLNCKINYRAISPTSNHYAQEVNNNSSIVLKNLDNNGIIGNIVLASADGKDKLDLYVRFNDGSKSLLSDQILLLRKILNLKY